MGLGNIRADIALPERIYHLLFSRSRSHSYSHSRYRTMKGANLDEYFGLLVASLILLIVLISTYMCIQLYHLRKPTPPCDCRDCRKDTFLGAFSYSPSCGSEWTGHRNKNCRGITIGVMPSIETDSQWGGGLCSGLLGVPP